MGAILTKQSIKLEHCLERVVDNRGKTPPLSESGIELLEVNAIVEGCKSPAFENARKFVSQETYATWFRSGHPRRGDTLISTVGAIGRVAFVKEERGCIAQNVVALRAKASILDGEFLYYYLASNDTQNRLLSLNIGVAQPSLKVPHLLSLVVELPPLLVQQRIAGILAAYDELIENSQRRIRLLEAMARAFYREWFVHFRFPGHEKHPRVASPLGDIPQGWEVKKLKDVCRLTMGQSPKSEFYNETGEGQPFHQGVTDFGDRFPTDRLFCTVEGRIAKAGDILFSVRAPVGRMNIADKKIIIGRGLSAIRHNDDHQAFLWEQLRNRFTEDDMMGNGAIFAAVTKNDMQGIELICPPSPLVVAATKHFEPIHTEVAALTKQIVNLRQTRDLLLPRLLSGQVNLEFSRTTVRYFQNQP
jgi:type I restriction enzyme S subunit